MFVKRIKSREKMAFLFCILFSLHASYFYGNSENFLADVLGKLQIIT